MLATFDEIKDKKTNIFDEQLKQAMDFSSWMLWYPDLFLDLIKPDTGGINLCSDQRLFMRSMTRFTSTYGVFSRGYG